MIRSRLRPRCSHGHDHATTRRILYTTARACTHARTHSRLSALALHAHAHAKARARARAAERRAASVHDALYPDQTTTAGQLMIKREYLRDSSARGCSSRIGVGHHSHAHVPAPSQPASRASSRAERSRLAVLGFSTRPIAAKRARRVRLCARAQEQGLDFLFRMLAVPSSIACNGFSVEVHDTVVVAQQGLNVCVDSIMS